MPLPTPSAPPADRWQDLLLRALDGFLPPEVPLERLLERFDRAVGDRT
jgi:hypothetical protein